MLGPPTDRAKVSACCSAIVGAAVYPAMIDNGDYATLSVIDGTTNVVLRPHPVDEQPCEVASHR